MATSNIENKLNRVIENLDEMEHRLKKIERFHMEDEDDEDEDYDEKIKKPIPKNYLIICRRKPGHKVAPVIFLKSIDDDEEKFPTDPWEFYLSDAGRYRRDEAKIHVESFKPLSRDYQKPEVIKDEDTDEDWRYLP